MNNRDPPLEHELAFAVERSEEDLATDASPGGEAGGSLAATRALPLRAVGTEGVSLAATAGVSTTNVELAIRGVGKNQPHTFDEMAASTVDGAATATESADSNMPDNDIHGGSDLSHTSSSVNSHQDQWTTAVTKAATYRSEQQRRCRGCREWWRSSAGGKSGVFSVVLAFIIILYAAIIVVLPFLTEVLDLPKDVFETFFQITMSVKVVVGSICVLLILFAAWILHRTTCARKSTLEDIAETAEARRNSKWFAVRVFELVQEGKGPNSPYVYVVLITHSKRKKIRTMHSSFSQSPRSLSAHRHLTR